jgi:hypothetical protein
MPFLISAGCWRLLWIVGLSSSLCSQPLVFYGASLRVQHCEFSSLPHPSSPGQVQHSTPISDVSVILLFAVYDFQFAEGGRFSLPRGCTGVFSRGGVG